MAESLSRAEQQARLTELRRELAHCATVRAKLGLATSYDVVKRSKDLMNEINELKLALDQDTNLNRQITDPS